MAACEDGVRFGCRIAVFLVPYMMGHIIVGPQHNLDILRGLRFSEALVRLVSRVPEECQLMYRHVYNTFMNI